MELRQLTETDRESYNRFVAQNRSGSFLQSWEWGQWQTKLGHTVHRFFVEQDRQIILTAQVIETSIAYFKKTYLYIPYGPLFSSNEAAEFFLTELKQKFSESLFIRVEAKEEIIIPGHSTVHIQPGKTSVLNLNQTEEELLANMHPKTRYNIKVAQRHGVRIISEPIVTPGHGLYLKEAVDLLVQTSKRQEFKSHASSYYEKLIDFLGLQTNEDGCHLEVYRAVLGTELLAAAIMIDFGSTRTYLFGGTAESQKNVMAPYALHWQAILDAKNKNLTAYDFWGIETATGKVPGFVRFKLGWGGASVSYPPAVDLVSSPAWYTIYNIFRKLKRKI